MPRHKTLHATMDWSHELLPEQERILFRRLSVFAGGFTLEAAESVCTGEDLEQNEVLDLLSRLVDKSLVITWEDRDGTRYRLLETVRQYGRERLDESEDEEKVERWHAGLFVGLAEEAEAELSGPDQTRWLRRLQTEHDNLRAALYWSLREKGDVGYGARLAAALWPFWFARGYLSEGRRWLESAVSESGSMAPTAKANALNGAGWLATFQEEYGAAAILVEEGLALYRELGDKEGIAPPPSPTSASSRYWGSAPTCPLLRCSKRPLGSSRIYKIGVRWPTCSYSRDWSRWAGEIWSRRWR
jgi:hypothetical protein